ncbi:MAG: hypothetical protein M1825_000872 [Sarcosagium campestre]|nr:MAG: hypothetical protein M1825_000872 [Sarcosagium campestre]
MSPTPIILLKTKSTPIDPYESQFSSSGSPDFTPYFLPPLTHRALPDAQARLERLISNSSLSTTHSGIILTSARAVESYIQILTASSPAGEAQLTIPHYVVGPATRSALSACPLVSPSRILGSHTGNGEELARFILKEHHRHDQHISQGDAEVIAPLLFLAGETHRNTLSRILQDPSLPPQNRLPIQILPIYTTGITDGFEEEVTRLVQNCVAEMEQHGDEGSTVSIPKQPRLWVVIFSPQGAEETLRAIGYLREGDDGVDDGRRRQRGIGVATIGPTTRDFLLHSFNFTADVCAAKPTPAAVAEGIGDFQGWLPRLSSLYNSGVSLSAKRDG